MRNSKHLSLPDSLIKAAKRNRLVPFIGAGLSANIDLPTWPSLMSLMGKDLGYQPPDLVLELGDYLQVAEYFVAERQSRDALAAFVSGELSTQKPFYGSKWRPYKLLMKWKPPMIYTTNFDTSIEDYYEYTFGKKPNVVSKVDHLRDLTEDESVIIKFHGDLRFPEAMVLTESDYFERLELESPLDIRFRHDLLQNTFVFLGYSFSDYNVRFIWYKLRKLLDPYRKEFAEGYESFFVASRTNQVFEKIMRPRGLETVVIDVDDTRKLIPTFLTKLLAAIGTK